MQRGFPSPPAPGPLQTERHRPVRNTGLHEHCAMRNEPGARIEAERMRLGMQMRGGITPRPGAIDQPAQDRLSDAAPAPCRADGHAADVTVGQQSPGADRLSVCRQRQGMRSNRIVRIPFEFFRNSLLDDEYCATHALQQRRICNPCGTADGKRRGGNHGAIIKPRRKAL